MKYVYDDGGRKAAGFKGTTGDCFCRAVSIAAQLPYKEVYNQINQYAKREHLSKQKKSISSAREGVYVETAKKMLADLGWKWVATTKIGTGCTVHLTEDELPKGRIICRLSKHYVSVVDGVIHDIYNPNAEWSPTDRCVYGYWYK